MNTSFGPWTTGIGVGPTQQLSTFWKRRITMLPVVAQHQNAFTRRQALKLGALGLGLAAWPTFQVGQAVQGSFDDERKDSPGRIYVLAQFKILREGAEDAAGEIIAVDPVTGDWESIRSFKSNLFSIAPDGTTLASGKLSIRNNYSRLTNVWLVDLKQPDAPPRTICDFGDWSVWSGDSSELIVPLLLSEPREEPWRYEHWRMNADGTNRVKLPIPEAHVIMDWSPDGRWLTTAAHDHPNAHGNHVYIIRPDGTDLRRMSTEDVSAYARFAPDSKRLAFVQRKRLVVVNLDGSDRREIYRAERDDSLTDLDWSPDGRHVAVIVMDWKNRTEESLVSNIRILIVDVADGSTRTLRIPGALFLSGMYWV